MMPSRATHPPGTHRAPRFAPDAEAVAAIPASLARIGERLRAVVSKRPSLAVGLWGEPGIGKTHAARWLLQQTPCHHCSVHAATPTRALLSALPKAMSLSAWVEAALERLDGGAPPEQTVMALLPWLEALAPFVLHVEDAHEASPERLELLGHLARALKRTRGLGLILTSRVPPPEGFEVHRLEPLDLGGSRALLEAEAGASLPREATAWIFERTRGNPLYALEFFRHLARRGHLWSDGARWRWNAPRVEATPESVEALIAQTLEAALEDDAVRAALEARAMLGLEVTDGLWAAVSGLSPECLVAARGQFERHGILRGERFAHPLYGEVVRRMLEPADRRRIARRAIEVLEPSDPTMAAGFVEQAELAPEAALPLLERAIISARATKDARSAARFLARTAAYSSGAERARWLLQASQAATQFDLTEGERLAALAVRAQPINAEAVVWHARVLIGLNRLGEATDLIEQLPDAVMPRTARLLTMIELKGLLGPERVLEVWEAHAEVRAQASAAARRLVAVALYDLGKVAAARTAFLGVLEMPELPVYERVGALNTLALIERDEGNLAQAEHTFTRALEAVEENRAPAGVMRLTALQIAAWEASLRVNRAVVYRRSGELNRAVEDAEAAIALFAEVGNPKLYAVAQTGLAELLVQRGEYARAEELLLEAQPVLDPATAEGVAVAVSLANLCLERDAPYARPLALKHARSAERQARSLSDLEAKTSALFVAGWAEALHGRPARALEHAASLEAIPRDAEQEQPRVQPLGLWVRAVALERLGRRAEAVNALRQAVVTASRLDALEAERIGLELDRLTEDAESARERIARAQASGNLNLVNLARRCFPALDPNAQPTPSERPERRVRLEALGAMRVDGQPLPERSRKSKELLALLLEARVSGRPDVPQIELLDALYPDLDADRGAGALRQLVFRMRASLSPDAILRGTGGYALGAVDTDVERFLETRDPSLWRGAYLEDIGEGFDSGLREILLDAARETVAESLELDPHEAARLGRIVLESDPYDRDALTLCLRALRAVGDEAGLNRLYKRSHVHFAEIGEALPEDWTALLENVQASLA